MCLPSNAAQEFPFEKKYSKKILTHRLSMTHSRTLLRRWFTVLLCLVPHQPPSYVALPGNHYYCWDAGESRRYVMYGPRVDLLSPIKHIGRAMGSRSLIQRNPLLPTYIPPYSRMRLLMNYPKPICKKPFYDTSQANDFPFKINGGNGKPRFFRL